MSKRPSSKRTTAELPRWRISRIKSTPAADIGTVQAPDAEAAIKEAIERFGIRNPHINSGWWRVGSANDR